MRLRRNHRGPAYWSPRLIPINPTSRRLVKYRTATSCRIYALACRLEPCGLPAASQGIPEGECREAHRLPRGSPRRIAAQPPVTAPAGERRVKMRQCGPSLRAGPGPCGPVSERWPYPAGGARTLSVVFGLRLRCVLTHLVWRSTLVFLALVLVYLSRPQMGDYTWVA